MSITVGEASAELSSGRRWYSYSGVVFGGGAVPALITLINVPNIGLRDSFIKILPYYSVPASFLPNSALGIQVTIDGIVVLKSQAVEQYYDAPSAVFELFVPKSSSLLIESRNTPANNTQERGCNVLGWYYQ